MRIKVGELRRLLEDAEAFQPEPLDVTEDVGASIDNQVDEFLRQYESSAQSVKEEGNNFDLMTRRLLGEAPEDDPLDAPADAPAAATNPDETPTADEPDNSVVPGPVLLPQENIDVESFASDVHRLIENFAALVEVKHAVHKRAVKYLSEHYEQAAVEEYKRTMRENYYIDSEESENDIQDDQTVAPDAVGAGNFQTPAG